MKAGREHRVPLSDAALEVLRRAKALDDNSGLVFPSLYKPGRELSDMTLTKLLRDLGLADRATVHGFRTSFKTWYMETTDTPWAVGEAALAHTLGNSTEAAYARSDLFEKRRTLMQQWGSFVSKA
ncbi:Prophage integrase IntA [Geodia barretti]|uniref:Prophage integrase IntA n=1 Tax=Geodia barretti TaxID=519541 RepID=A0AA35R8Z7_GEOBA|nr:Prophage integrase IntA [Geodia barretti]